MSNARRIAMGRAMGRFRAARNLSRSQLAAMLGLTANDLADAENGHERVTQLDAKMQSEFGFPLLRLAGTLASPVDLRTVAIDGQDAFSAGLRAIRDHERGGR